MYGLTSLIQYLTCKHCCQNRTICIPYPTISIESQGAKIVSVQKISFTSESYNSCVNLSI